MTTAEGDDGGDDDDEAERGGSTLKAHDEEGKLMQSGVAFPPAERYR